MPTNTTTTDAAAAIEYARQKAFDYIQKNLVILKSATPCPLPLHSGKTIKAYRRQTLAPAITPLGEGVTPTGQVINSTQFTATLKQYGAWAPFSDLLEDIGPSSFAEQAKSILAYNGKETLDKLAYLAYVNNASNYYAGNASQASFSSTSYATSRDLRILNKIFRHYSVPRFEDGYYRFYHDADVIADITADPAVGGVIDLQRREEGNEKKWLDVAGIYAGFKVFETGIVDKVDDVGDQQVDGVYQGVACGYDALACFELGKLPEGGNKATGMAGGFRLIYVPPDFAAPGNELGQVGSIGWKAPQALMWIGTDVPRAYIVNAVAQNPS
jgi:N4-gp56 family major capsid protein